MLTNEEKIRFWDTVVDTTNWENDSSDLANKSHDLLMKDSGGKLYKYLRFDKDGHSIESVKNNTLHCSLPKEFNDPFDCKLGFDYQSLLLSFYEIRGRQFLAIFNAFILVYETGYDIKSFDIPVQKLLQSWLDDSDFCKKYDAMFCSLKTEEERLAFWQCNQSFLDSKIESFFYDKNFPTEIPKTTKIISDFQLQNPQDLTLLSDTQTTNEEIAKTFNIEDDVDEIDLWSIVLKKLGQHDERQLENVNTVFEKIEKQCHQFQNIFCMGCLSTNMKSRLMWSHYTMSHQGFCIEYDFSDKSSFAGQTILPVTYSTKRVKFPYEPAFNNDISLINKHIIRSFFVKDSEWEYEHEWRMIAQFGKDENVPMPPISCIYLGANITEENEATIVEIAKEKGIPVKKMTIDRGEFELHAKEP